MKRADPERCNVNGPPAGGREAFHCHNMTHVEVRRRSPTQREPERSRREVGGRTFQFKSKTRSAKGKRRNGED